MLGASKVRRDDAFLSLIGKLLQTVDVSLVASLTLVFTTLLTLWFYSAK